LTYTEELEELVEDVNKGKSRMYIVGGYNAEDSYDEVRSHDYIKRYFRKTDSSDEGRIRGLWEVLKEVLDI
jgi:2-iminoacetate synthase ThiH